MKTLRIFSFGSARVWLGECPDAMCSPQGLVERVLPAGVETPKFSAVCLEVSVPRGAYRQYALLGLSLRMEEASLRLEVPWTRADGPTWNASAPIEDPRVGLPHEFAAGVTEELAAVSRFRLPAGVLAVRAAVHSPVGSSNSIMVRVARGCVELMLRGDMPEDELRAFLESIL